MNDVHQMLRRQADWQKTRATLGWPEKIKQAEVLREACLKLRSANLPQRAGNKVR